MGDISNREKALSDLDLIVENRYVIPLKDIFDAMEILALCYEISGDKNKACESVSRWLSVLNFPRVWYFSDFTFFFKEIIKQNNEVKT